MKTSSPIFKILSVAVLVAVVVYFAAQLYNYLSDPISTTAVYSAHTEDTIAVNGYVVRNEETFSSSAGTLAHMQSEGAKVGVGQTLAMVYPSAEIMEKTQQIDALELKMEQLQFALASYMDRDAALKLDSTITESIVVLRRDTADGDYITAIDKLPALKTAVMKRDYSYTTKEDIEQEIAAVQNEINTLIRDVSGAKAITTERSGTYSAVCDGYETVLTPDMLSVLTVGQLQSVRPAQTTANVGKLMYGDRWYYAAVIDESDAALLKGRSRVTLRFAKGLNFDITVYIDRIGEAENGKCVLVLHCDRYLAQTTLLRHQAGQLILKGYEGLRLPANALRISQSGQSGVYCVVGVTARFKPVDVIYRGDGFVLVKPDAKATGSAILRVGDQVIASSGDLFDGKVVG